MIPTGLIEPDGSAVLLIDIQADGLQSRFPAHFCGMAKQCPSYAPVPVCRVHCQGVHHKGRLLKGNLPAGLPIGAVLLPPEDHRAGDLSVQLRNVERAGFQSLLGILPQRIDAPFPPGAIQTALFRVARPSIELFDPVQIRCFCPAHPDLHRLSAPFCPVLVPL